MVEGRCWRQALGAGEMVTPRCPHCEAVGRGLVGPALLSHSLNPTLGEV